MAPCGYRLLLVTLMGREKAVRDEVDRLICSLHSGKLLV